MKPESMDNLFHALASAPRREILDIVKDRPGCSVMEVCKHFDVSRIAVMKHLNVLEKSQPADLSKAGQDAQAVLQRDADPDDPRTLDDGIQRNVGGSSD